MKAFVTSIGEPTTRLCCDQLRKHGFEVVLLKDDRTLWGKLKAIYDQADDDFLRVDADLVPNRNIASFWDTADPGVWWLQARCFDWWKQDVGHGGAQFIRKAALPYLRVHVGQYEHADRPETELSRIRDFHEPRRFVSSDVVVGLHGYGQADMERVKAVKRRRKQYDNYDFDLVERLEAL